MVNEPFLITIMTITSIRILTRLRSSPLQKLANTFRFIIDLLRLRSVVWLDGGSCIPVYNLTFRSVLGFRI